MRKTKFQVFTTLVLFFLVAFLGGISFAIGATVKSGKNTQITKCEIVEHTVMGTVYCFVKCSSLKRHYNATTVKTSVATSKNDAKAR